MRMRCHTNRKGLSELRQADNDCDLEDMEVFTSKQLKNYIAVYVNLSLHEAGV